MLEAATYTRIYGQQQLGKYWCVYIYKDIWAAVMGEVLVCCVSHCKIIFA